MDRPHSHRSAVSMLSAPEDRQSSHTLCRHQLMPIWLLPALHVLPLSPSWPAPAASSLANPQPSFSFLQASCSWQGGQPAGTHTTATSAVGRREVGGSSSSVSKVHSGTIHDLCLLHIKDKAPPSQYFRWKYSRTVHAVPCVGKDIDRLGAPAVGPAKGG